ncbi:hypothetical protein B0T26DRAFT_750933 [Lasiosphaeria miniovina]|uniref:Uncharacterized protein n=1 Tax=Lasiosphaeria miniovina TaxID=1954250 RepID=A0AA40AJ51_9PEZI|nr:uncharacterized protein B0T26DRAFT_750933 [Lasiosphaeria miniovina]KAK0716787.1 hypothetical protein B0T26DRAFT_750933 [Lasiosphaeria miniovina]
MPPRLPIPFAAVLLGLYYCLGLAAGLAMPLAGPRSDAQLSMLSYGAEACHSVLTSCRQDADCCPGLRCKKYDSESFCIPGG